MFRKIGIALFMVTLQLHGSVNQAGQPVISFGVNGTATLSSTEGSVLFVNALVDTQGRIVVVGFINAVGALIARFTSRGELDTSFYRNGYRVFQANNTDDRASAVGILGQVLYVSVGSQPTGCYVVSFTDSGDFNTSWGNGTGIYHIEQPGFDPATISSSLLVQQDGKIVVCGNVDSGNTNGYVARVNSTGTALDGTFNISDTPGYVVLTNFPAQKLMFLSNARIAALGTVQNGDCKVYVFTDSGALDTSFNGTGMSATMTGIIFNSFVLQSTGNIVVIGPTAGGGQPSILAKRLLPNGTLDTTFGSNGTATLYDRATSYSAAMTSINDNFFVGVSAFTNPSRVVVALGANGFRDTTFGINGIAVMSSTIPYTLIDSGNGTMVSVGTNFVNGYIEQFTQYNIAQVGFSGSGLTVGSNGEIKVEPIFKIPVLGEDLLPDYVIAGFNGF